MDTDINTNLYFLGKPEKQNKQDTCVYVQVCTCTGMCEVDKEIRSGNCDGSKMYSQ